MSDAIADAKLYESDFFAWTQLQAKKLKRLQAQTSNLDLDLPHLAEEIEDLGKAERAAARSQLERIIEHCLELEYSPASEPARGWQRSIMDARATLDEKLTRTLQRDLRASLPRLFELAREYVESELRDREEDAGADALPSACPYSLEDLLRRGWYPEKRSATSAE